jgi:hypothetical protein
VSQSDSGLDYSWIAILFDSIHAAIYKYMRRGSCTTSPAQGLTSVLCLDGLETKTAAQSLVCILFVHVHLLLRSKYPTTWHMLGWMFRRGGRGFEGLAGCHDRDEVLAEAGLLLRARL